MYQGQEIYTIFFQTGQKINCQVWTFVCFRQKFKAVTIAILNEQTDAACMHNWNSAMATWYLANYKINWTLLK